MFPSPPKKKKTYPIVVILFCQFHILFLYPELLEQCEILCTPLNRNTGIQIELDTFNEIEN